MESSTPSSETTRANEPIELDIGGEIMVRGHWFKLTEITLTLAGPARLVFQSDMELMREPNIFERIE